MVRMFDRANKQALPRQHLNQHNHKWRLAMIHASHDMHSVQALTTPLVPVAVREIGTPGTG